MGLGLREHCRFAVTRHGLAVMDELTSVDHGITATILRPEACGPARPEAEIWVNPRASALDSGPTAPAAWYALRVKPRHEKAVAEALRVQGFEEFLPLYKERRRWSDRTKEIETPLFANYTFCRFAAQHRLGVLRVPGVVGVVRFGDRLAEVDAGEIEAVRAAAGSGRIVRPCEFLVAGQRVRIVSGPLANVEGIFQRFSGSEQLVVSVTILQRSVAVELEGDAVIPIPAHRSYAASSTVSNHTMRRHGNFSE